MEEKSRTKKAAVILLLAIAIIMLLFVFILSSGKTVEMNIDEWFLEDRSWNDSYIARNPDFPTLNAGDTVQLTGEITEIRTVDGEYTWIRLYSPQSGANLPGGNPFDYPFIGNITGNYSSGDNITITFSIVKDTIGGVSGEYIAECNYPQVSGLYGMSEEVITKN